VDNLRAAAACPALKPEKAVEFLDQAAKIIAGDPEGGNRVVTEKKAFDEWSRVTGVPVENLDVVYRAVAEMKKKDLEAEAAKEQRSKTAIKKAQKQGGRRGKIGT
jgi:hypothetical protein